MARPLRLELAGGWYHVTARGNERKEVFRDDRDRERFVLLLAELEKRYGLEVHGYVLMANHYHLFLRLRNESGLSAGMQWLAVSYTVWFNRRHRRSGHLFQGRYKAVLVEFECWGQELSRYLHLNPVRLRRHGLDKRARKADRVGLGEKPSAQMVKGRLNELNQYRWSSYRSYIGLSPIPEWLRIEEVLAGFGGKRIRQREYRNYMEGAILSGVEESPWDQVKAGLLLGGGDFIESMKARLSGNPSEQPGLSGAQKKATREDIVRWVEELKGEAWADFVNQRGDWGRDLALQAIRRNTALTNGELGKWLGGLDDSTVAQAVRRFTKRMEGSAKLKKICRMLEVKIAEGK